MQRGLVGSEMCIRDSINAEYMGEEKEPRVQEEPEEKINIAEKDLGQSFNDPEASPPHSSSPPIVSMRDRSVFEGESSSPQHQNPAPISEVPGHESQEEDPDIQEEEEEPDIKNEEINNHEPEVKFQFPDLGLEEADIQEDGDTERPAQENKQEEEKKIDLLDVRIPAKEEDSIVNNPGPASDVNMDEDEEANIDPTDRSEPAQNMESQFVPPSSLIPK
eukprot:TRINITY_DN28929_c0_g1_i1.p1 TRINITY_DN28929_c0_g1~~TRINITY_DN28929_c0_g1_i1.p1  ORF type:complete len:219 (-),score=72.25 TRINITY_DN28929_c0_g1_i1:45-701(-)